MSTLFLFTHTLCTEHSPMLNVPVVLCSRLYEGQRCRDEPSSGLA